MATVATGVPRGIWTMESRESSPPRCRVGMGTPITGRGVCEAVMPGRCAALAAPLLRRRCPHGVKMPPESHMIANWVRPEDVKDVLEVDSLTYLTPDELEEAVKHKRVCTLCMRP